MRRYLIGFTILVFSVTLGVQPQQALSQTEQSNPITGMEGQAFAPGRIIVKAEEKAPANAVESLNRRTDARIEEKIPHSRVSVVDLPQDLSVTEAVERYESSPDVQYAEPDYRLYPAEDPNDPEFSKQYNLLNTGQYGGTVDADVDAREAWDVTAGNANTVVAVIDTGIDINHTDLKNNVWVNEDEIPGNGTDDDDNGYVDDVNGWDFRNEDNTVFDADENPHGTHVAGTIAAEGDNGIGVAGVSWRTKVMPLKFIGPETGYTSDAIEALNYAVEN
ncbi:MAG: S8 family serine peptidase, partial [Actinomycetota bacterium]|nr:S8 family serine peptidase [Actinomycetota bacterium]